MITISSDEDSLSELDVDPTLVMQKKYLKPTPNQPLQNKCSSTLIGVNNIPEQFRSIFPFANFNCMQSESFKTIFHTDSSCVISSPTGSGKTVLFELAIIKLLQQKISSKDDSLINAKILYLAPTKALCTERYDDWCRKFKPLNCTVGMLTGDSTLAELDNVKKSCLIICTPEKWDVLTRRWADYSKLLDLVKLLLVDEIHFIRETRGTTLEVVITRMMTMSLNLRILALSATVPNINDVSNWFESNDKNKIKTLIYDDNYRSVKLNKIVYGYKNAGTNNSFMLDQYYNSKIQEIIRKHSKNKPVMIFCPTRNSTVKTAKFLAQENPHHHNKITNAPFGVSKEIVGLVEKGVAYHNAGLSLPERRFIEENFINGNVKILCSTSTLAVGVNLPAYLVIIKGTQTWNNNSMEEYNELDVLQMMGRAGRPQFEKEGCCVIMTEGNQKDRYSKLIKGNESLESSLHLNIFENITAEVFLKTITSLESAFKWLKSTFFYQRYIQNPTAYLTVFSKVNQTHPLDVQLKIFLKDIIDELIAEQLIETVNGQFCCTVYGEALCKSYVMYETVKLLIKANPNLGLKDVLELVSKANEFSEMKVRYNQRRLYKEINMNPLIFDKFDPTKLDTYWAKVSLLIQFELGGLEFPVFQGSVKFLHEFKSEKASILKTLPRVLKAAIEIFSHKKDATSTNSFLKLNRCIAAKAWENTFLVLKQFDGVGVAYARKLKSHGISSVDKLRNLSREKIEQYIGLKPGAGQKLFKNIACLPDLAIKVNNVKAEKNGNVSFEVEPLVNNESKSLTYVWNGNYTTVYVLIELEGVIVDFRRLPLRKLMGSNKFWIKHQFKYQAESLKVYFDAETIAGIGKVVNVDVRTVTAGLPKNIIASKMEESDDEFSDSINFSDDNEISVIETPILQTEKNSRNNTTISFDKSLTGEISTIECNHKCGDKSSCRHICCKEGIPQPKLKSCKHACKDKSNCRHMCCREQHQYESKKALKVETKQLKQKQLDLHSFKKDVISCTFPTVSVTPSKTNVDSDSEFSDVIENSSDSSFSELKPQINKVTKFVPVFLKKIAQTNDQANPVHVAASNSGKGTKYAQLSNTTSKYFNFSVDPRHKPTCLLDEPVENDLDGSFDSTLDDFLSNGKRITPVSRRVNKRPKNDIPEMHSSKHTDQIPIKYKSLNAPEIKEAHHIGSVEDIVMLNQTLPKVVSLKTKCGKRIGAETSLESHESENSIESVDLFNTKIDNTFNTSIEEMNIEKDVVLDFLDSDIDL